MSDKSQWPRVKFGDVVQQVKDKVDPQSSGLDRYIGGEHMDTDDLRIRRWGEISDDYLGPAFHMRFRPGQVLYGSRRTYLRKVAWTDFEGICANTTFVLESADPDVLLPELLPFIMQTEGFHDHSVKQSKGSVNPYVNFSDLAWYEFALPPMAEQRRIAEVLWAVEEMRNQIDSALQESKRLMNAYLAEFLSQFQGSEYVSTVDELLIEPPKNGYSPRTNGSGIGLRTVSISAISDGQFMPNGNVKFADVDEQAVSSFFVNEGDVFVVRGNGNRNLAGRCGIAEESYEDLFYPDLLIRLRFNPARILPRFGSLQWNSANVHRDFISRAKSTNGIWKINGQDVRNHQLVVPSLEQQSEFLSSYGEIERTHLSIEVRSTAVSLMKRAILNSHMTGT